MNVPYALLGVVFLHRRIRAVGPMVFLLVLICLTGAEIAIDVVGGHDRVLYALVSLGSEIGMGAYGLFAAILLTGAAAFYIAGKWALHGLAAAYKRRWISDQALLATSLWLLYGLFVSILLTFQRTGLIFTFVLAFAVYELALRTGMRATRSERRPTPLIQLRVFSLGDNSARLFAALSSYWRTIGPIRLISGPDLATTLVEPHEFFEFLSRRAEGLFIGDASEAGAHISVDIDIPDPNGRYRVYEYFCREGTWRTVLSRLLSEQGAILMDLRTFSEKNSGCVHELRELMLRVPFDRVALVVNRDTDRRYLRQVLEAAWRDAPAGSPNLPDCRVQLCSVETLDPKSLRRLLHSVCDAAESGAVPLQTAAGAS